MSFIFYKNQMYAVNDTNCYTSFGHYISPRVQMHCFQFPFDYVENINSNLYAIAKSCQSPHLCRSVSSSFNTYALNSLSVLETPYPLCVYYYDQGLKQNLKGGTMTATGEEVAVSVRSHAKLQRKNKMTKLLQLLGNGNALFLYML